VAFVDSLHDPNSTARDQFLRTPQDTIVTRRLNDGQEFEIVKVFYAPDELQARLKELGWKMSVKHTAQFFLIGYGSLL
jgi:demethylmenaquinone methyltransferase/2-methoxy-6-polyprenyl-1,4-benzoquinol methylase